MSGPAKKIHRKRRDELVASGDMWRYSGRTPDRMKITRWNGGSRYYWRIRQIGTVRAWEDCQ